MVSAEVCIAAIESDKGIKDATKKKHITTLKAMATDRRIKDSEWEQLFSDAIPYIAAKWPNPSTAKGKSDSLVKLWRVCADVRGVVPDIIYTQLHEHMTSHADKAEAAFKKGENPKFAKKGVLTWNQVVEAERILMESHRATQDQVYFSLLVHVYVPRNEPRTIRVARDEKAAEELCPGENVLLLKERRLVLRQHKTSDVYKTTEFAVPTEVMESVKEMMAKREAGRPQRHQKDDTPLTYLFFVESIWKPYKDSGSFSHWVARISERHLGRPYTANEYRHIYASSVKLNASMEDIEASAKKMHHSVGKHLAYRVKAVLQKEQEKTDDELVADLMCRMGFDEFMKLVRRSKVTLAQACSRTGTSCVCE